MECSVVQNYGGFLATLTVYIDVFRVALYCHGGNISVSMHAVSYTGEAETVAIVPCTRRAGNKFRVNQFAKRTVGPVDRGSKARYKHDLETYLWVR